MPIQLHHIFIRNAVRFRKKLAIIDRTTGKRLTYSQTLIASLALAKKFQSFDPGFIGIMIPSSAGCALAVLSVLMSGRIPVMINYSTGAAVNAVYAQDKCAFKTIITSKALLTKIKCPLIAGMVFLEDFVSSISNIDKIRSAITSKLPLPILLRSIHSGDRDDTAVILFTSGSEKDPKAVQLSHNNIYSNIESMSLLFGLSDKEIMLASLPFFHVFGQTANLWLSFYHGMTMVTIANPLEYKCACDSIREEHATIIAGTPAFLSGYLRRSEPGDFRSLRIVFSAADKCPEALRHAFLQQHQITLYEAYGTTETSPSITSNCPASNRPGSVGRVIPGVEILIENYVTGEPCVNGETGRILVKGPNVMKGYFDDFEETANRIRHGWYDTGDMGYRDNDGFLWHVGRLKRFVKIGGEMISLVKVEGVLEHILPADCECCVVELPDPLKGAKIVAAVTGDFDEQSTLKKMSASLPNISLPKHFIPMKELPKMGSGKIDFRSVTDIARTMLG